MILNFDTPAKLRAIKLKCYTIKNLIVVLERIKDKKLTEQRK